MNLLLDTHTFLWHYSGAAELSQNAKSIINSSDMIFLSVQQAFGRLLSKTALENFILMPH
jgi:PIN domain nuclease of toxin-antitoxin system